MEVLCHMQRRQTPSRCRGESVFSIHRRECPSVICRGGRLLDAEALLYVEETESFSVQRRERERERETERVSVCHSAIWRGHRLLLYAEERASSLHRGESVHLLNTHRRECSSAICTRDRLLLSCGTSWQSGIALETLSAV